MMDMFEKELNTLLVDTFRLILKVEDNTIRSYKTKDLTINEMHLLESVGKNKDGRTISDIAQDMDITLPSVTVAINKLEKKGYVEKVKCQDDGRRVFVSLTRAGRKINAAHSYFHEQMVRSISKEFNKEEKKVLLECVSKLNSYFDQKASDGVKGE